MELKAHASVKLVAAAVNESRHKSLQMNVGKRDSGEIWEGKGIKSSLALTCVDTRVVLVTFGLVDLIVMLDRGT